MRPPIVLAVGYDTWLTDARRKSILYQLLRAGANLDPLINYMPNDHHSGAKGCGYWNVLHGRNYFRAIRAAGGFRQYADLCQDRLRNIKLLARRRGRLRLPEARRLG